MGYVSKTPNKSLMTSARASLSGRWGIAIGAVVIFNLIYFVCNILPLVGVIAPLIITGPFAVGLVIFSLSIARGQEPQIAQIFEGFGKFGTALGAYLLQTIFVILWSLLLIIPGIIAAYSYAMTFYIIADDDTIGPLEAIKKSKEMMQGNKWKYFCLCWRFFGWLILCVLTLGIGFLWLSPYMMVSFAQFYEDLKKEEELMQARDVPETA